MRLMHNPELDPKRSTRPIPADPKERFALQRKGYSFVEEIVDTATGGLMLVPSEEHVQNGRAVGALLAKKRKDAGHEDEPAFMLPEQWAKLSEAEKARMLKPKKEEDATLVPAAKHVETIAMQNALLAAQAEQLKALEAKVAALASGGGGRK